MTYSDIDVCANSPNVKVLIIFLCFVGAERRGEKIPCKCVYFHFGNTRVSRSFLKGDFPTFCNFVR